MRPIRCSSLFGFQEWTDLSKPRDLEKIFETVEYAKWRSFRDSEDARFVSLVMPRVLARLPYGSNTKPVEAFAYEEVPLDDRAHKLKLVDQVAQLVLDSIWRLALQQLDDALLALDHLLELPAHCLRIG